LYAMLDIIAVTVSLYLTESIACYQQLNIYWEWKTICTEIGRSKAPVRRRHARSIIRQTPLI
jgi:hypothetical protein